MTPSASVNIANAFGDLNHDHGPQNLRSELGGRERRDPLCRLMHHGVHRRADQRGGSAGAASRIAVPVTTIPAWAGIPRRLSRSFQPFPRPHQPNAERSDWTLKLACGRFQAQAFEVAEHHRFAVFAWEPFDFLVENLEVVAILTVAGSASRRSFRRFFVPEPCGGPHQTGLDARPAVRPREANLRPSLAA